MHCLERIHILPLLLLLLLSGYRATTAAPARTQPDEDNCRRAGAAREGRQRSGGEAESRR